MEKRVVTLLCHAVRSRGEGSEVISSGTKGMCCLSLHDTCTMYIGSRSRDVAHVILGVAVFTRGRAGW
jgi:hypothetical protein